MPKTTTQEDHQCFDKLLIGGIPLDEEHLGEIRTTSRGLGLRQADTLIDTSIFELNSGDTGFMLSIAIYDDSDRTLRHAEARLKLPWWEPRIRWLWDPARQVPRQFTYEFPASSLVGIARDAVLNHRLGKTKIVPGDSIEGLFLAVGGETIPDEYQDRQCVVAQFSLFDARGNRSDLDVSFLVQLDGRSRRRRVGANSSRVRSLLQDLHSPDSCGTGDEPGQSGSC